MLELSGCVRLAMDTLGISSNIIFDCTSGKNTLWVKWVNAVKLKGKSIWDIQKEYNDNWIWKTLLDLRGKIRKNVYKVLGDEKSTNVWHDQWSSVGIQSDIVNNRDIYNARLKDSIVPNLNLQEKDVTKWKYLNGKLIDFSSKAVWEVICSHNNECDYSRVIWEHLKEKMDNGWLSNSWDNLVDQYERNARLFTREAVDDKIVLKIIIENVKQRNNINAVKGVFGSLSNEKKEVVTVSFLGPE
ncbi:hypothetical protein Tco_0285044 [Tanacetum coccineum]